MSNPLKKYYRIPGIQITLPSKGIYNKDIETSLNGEIEIFPFTTEDELYLANPDSLLNGSALEHLVKSCAPGIKDDPKSLPMEDINAIILAAKYSTYGDNLDLGIICPNCAKEYTVSVSIRNLLRGIKYFPEETSLETGDGLKINLMPLTLEKSTKLQLAELQNMSMVQALLNKDIPEEEKSKLLTPSIASMVHNALDVIIFGILNIEVEDNDNKVLVEDNKQIREFIENAPSSLTNEIKKKQEEFLHYGVNKDIHNKCPGCKHEWTSKLDVDPTSFFGQNS